MEKTLQEILSISNIVQKIQRHATPNEEWEPEDMIEILRNPKNWNLERALELGHIVGMIQRDEGFYDDLTPEDILERIHRIIDRMEDVKTI